MNIGTNLRKLRDKLRLSSREVAEKTGVSLSTYLDWEHDKTAPSLKSFAKLSIALQLCPVELMSYVMNRSHEIAPTEEKRLISELREVIAHFQHYVDDLKTEKNTIESELSLLRGKNRSVRVNSKVDF